VEEGALIEVEKGGNVAVKGKLIAPKGSKIEVKEGATIDLTSTDSDGAEDENVDTVPKIGGKVEAKGKGANLIVDDIDLEGEGSLSTKNKAKLTFARSERVKYRGKGRKPHKIKLGIKFASLSKEDSDKAKQSRREKKEEEDVSDELEKTENTTSDQTKKDMTKDNLIARMKERGILKNDGT